MESRKPAIAGILSAVVFFTGACSESPTASSSTDPASRTQTSAQLSNPSEQPEFQGIEQSFAALSDSIPGFAGYYYDRSGTLVIRVADASASLNSRVTGATKPLAPVPESTGQSATAQVRRVFEALRRPLKATRVTPAPFAFVELARWRDAIMHNLPDGVYSVDLDEEHNRVRIGVAEPGIESKVREVARTSGVPEVAVQTFIAPKPQLRSTLWNNVRPVAAGLQIGWSGAPGAYCTAGVNASYLFTYPVLLTASHCSLKYVQLDGTGSGATSYYQPNVNTSANRIGNEFDDPHYFTGGSCPAGAACRWSDALAVYYNPQSLTAYNKLARPSGSPAYLSAGSSLTIGGYLNVIGTWSSAPVGEELMKVGATSGWTRGYVTATCVNRNMGFWSSVGANVWILCSDATDIHSEPGDSGAGIFKWYGGTDVYFVGLLFGGPTNNYNVTWHSNLWGIERELIGYAVNTQ